LRSFVLAAGVLHQAKFALGGPIVDEKKMAENLDNSRLIVQIRESLQVPADSD
jgi:3-carboxy-cis,cis-muconate cycloisomerase